MCTGSLGGEAAGLFTYDPRSGLAASPSRMVHWTVLARSYRHRQVGRESEIERRQAHEAPAAGTVPCCGQDEAGFLISPDKELSWPIIDLTKSSPRCSVLKLPGDPVDDDFDYGAGMEKPLPT